MPTEIRIEPILPKRRNYPANFADILEREIGNVLKGPASSILLNAFRARTAGWKDFVPFRSDFKRRDYKGNLTGFSIRVGPYGNGKRFWIFVSGGVAPHTISPRRKPYLFIRGGQGGYTSKTDVGDVYGRSSWYDLGNSYITNKAVHHPGIRARSFEKHIVEQNEAQLVGLVLAAVARALR